MKLTEVVPWGRTFAEYQLMFGLSQADLEAQILGCGDGPASFNAEMTALGQARLAAMERFCWITKLVRLRNAIDTNHYRI